MGGLMLRRCMQAAALARPCPRLILLLTLLSQRLLQLWQRNGMTCVGRQQQLVARGPRHLPRRLLCWPCPRCCQQ